MPGVPLASLAARAAAAALLAASALLPVRADEGGGANVYMAGADVRIASPVGGDLVAAAGRITVDAPVAGDAILGAGSIDVRGRIGDDLRAGGGIVTVAGTVAGEAVLAAGSIAFGPTTEIYGRARLAARTIAVAGRLTGGLDAYARTILILGEVRGPLKLTAERIEVMSGAHIRGDLHYRSPAKIVIRPGARVEGSVTHEPLSLDFPGGIELPGLSLPPLSPLITLGLFAAGVLLLLLFPRFTVASLDTIGAAPVKSLGLGTAILFSFPPVILLLLITIIGIPVALALAALYAVALLAGYLVTAFFVGDRLARLARRARSLAIGWRALSLLAGILVLWLARSIPLPYVGGLVLLLALTAGVGAMVLQAFTSYAGRR